MPFDTETDPRFAPAYGASEAAQILALPPGTVRAWSFGHDYLPKAGGRRRRFQRVIAPADDARKLLSFVNLCELHVLAAIRRLHNVKLGAVRTAVEFVRDELKVDRPLASAKFMTNGIDLFVDQAGELLAVSLKGQRALREGFERQLSRIEFDRRTDMPIALFPFTRSSDDEKAPRTVLVDATRSFGRPLLAGAGVRTEVIEQRFRAGDSIADMALDYGVEAVDIEEALRFESRRAA